MRQRAVVEPAVVLKPRGWHADKVLRRNGMMLAVHHATQPREERLGLVGAGIASAVGLRMVYAVNLPTGVQRIPMLGFVRVHDGGALYDPLGDLNAFAFRLADECHGAALALAKCDHDEARSGLVPS